MKHSRTDATELAASALAMAPTERAVLPAALAGTTSGGLPDRVALYVIAVVGVFAVLWLPRLVFSPWLDPRGLRALLAPAALSHVALVFFLFVLSLAARTAKADRTVRAIELAATLVVPFVGIFGQEEVEPLSRQELSALIGVILILVMRAAIVPSSPGWTLLAGSAAVVPVCIYSAVMYASDIHLQGTPLGVIAAITVSAWGGAAIVATAVMSRTLFGLRRQVERARALGQYVLGRKLGEGGMGEVYEAEHAMLRRRTAVKLIQPHLVGSMARERFEREALLTSRLAHPNTVAIYDFGRTPTGILYYAMEVIDGASLHEVIRASGAMPAARVKFILGQVAGSVGEAHELGLVHRDIKPGNIMLCERAGTKDFVKVLDFGLVKDFTVAAAGTNTNANTILGTPHYLAPEAISSSDAPLPAADVYAIGVLGYFLLTGILPFDGTSLVMVAAAQLATPPVPPSLRVADVPEDLERVILRCLEKEPHLRYADGDALQAALAGCSLTAEWSAGDAAACWEAGKPRAKAGAEAAVSVATRTEP